MTNNYRRFRDVTIPVALHTAAKQHAHDTGTSLRQVISDAVAAYLAARGVPVDPVDPSDPPANQPPLPFPPSTYI